MSEGEDSFDFENIPAETPLSPDQAILRRHRREKKELQGKIVAMKKSSVKSDKKKKKELADEILNLETELEQRHKSELDAFTPKRVDLISTEPETLVPEIHELTLKENTSTSTTLTPLNSSTPGTPKISRAQKRREKKSIQEREKEKRIEFETEILVENSEWKKEDKQLEGILNDLNLKVFEIPADGHCLYSAVSHQLEETGGNPLGVDSLRQVTASYLRNNKNDFINYFDESISGSDENFKNYCKEIETTAAWGGQVEIQVMSKVLKRPIRVFQATGPPLLFGEDYKENVLNLTYHRFKIQAGEHYNSTVLNP